MTTRSKPRAAPLLAPMAPMAHEAAPSAILEIPPDVAARLLCGVFRRDLRRGSARATADRKARRERGR